MKFFKVLNFEVRQSSFSIYHNFLARIWEGFLSYEVHHKLHYFVCHSFSLPSHFEVRQNSCLPMSISKLLSTNVSQSSYLPVFVSKLLSTNVFRSSYLRVFVSKLMSTNCVFQSFCLFMSTSKLLSTSVCLKASIYHHLFT